MLVLGAATLLKQVQIVVPYDKTEPVFGFIVDNLNVKNVLRFATDTAHILQFRIADDTVLETVEKLKSRGVGVEYGFIDIMDLRTSLPREADETSEKRIQREAALAVEEIYDNVRKQASLSFDFIAFVVLAAVMAGFGLAQNNVTVIVASMLLSPLMGPMLGVALGYVVGDHQLFVKGTRNELIALGLSFAVGAIMALLLPLVYPPLISTITSDIDGGILTEITRRAGFNAIDVGIAIFSGAAVAVSVTRGDMSTLVGVAISAALMPPAVNVGLMIVLGLVSSSGAMVQIGVGSLMLLVMNIVIIDIAAIIMFRIKKLTTIADKSATWKAVTQFQKTGTTTLYHNVPAQVPAQAIETPSERKSAASFTPAQATPEKPSKEKPSQEDETSTKSG
ncbi:TIGR00341 family protein [Candidatus Thorarchaeota archaeon]|nr:MAG: TIGR00341 family protein [Candidatus Thorarchaeota archaeon]